MAEYIDRAALVGEKLTSAESQLRFRGMTGAEAYNEFQRIVNDTPAADLVSFRDLEAWLHQISMNNIETTLGENCEEIIRRLDGLRRFAADGGAGNA